MKLLSAETSRLLVDIQAMLATKLICRQLKPGDKGVVDAHLDQILVQFQADLGGVARVELIQIDLVVLHRPQDLEGQVEAKLVDVVVSGDLLQAQVAVCVHSKQIEQLGFVHARGGRLLEEEERQRLTCVRVLVRGVGDAMEVERDLEPLGYDLECESRVESEEVHG